MIRTTYRVEQFIDGRRVSHCECKTWEDAIKFWNHCRDSAAPTDAYIYLVSEDGREQLHIHGERFDRGVITP